MVSVLILAFVTGLLFANGVPHFVKGVSGEKFRTPFGNPSPAVVNVAWGWLNFVVGVLLWHLAPMKHHPRAAFLAFAVGILLMGAALAAGFSKNTKHSK